MYPANLIFQKSFKKGKKLFQKEVIVFKVNRFFFCASSEENRRRKATVVLLKGPLAVKQSKKGVDILKSGWVIDTRKINHKKGK